MPDSKFFETLKGYEGFSARAYLDSRGCRTVGYGSRLYSEDAKWLKYIGHTLEGLMSGKESLTELEADRLMRWRFHQILAAVSRADMLLYASLGSDVRRVVDDLLYNLGPNFLAKFPKFRVCLHEYADTGNREWLMRAANELEYRNGLDPSKGRTGYWNQTKRRAKANVALLRGIATGD